MKRPFLIALVVGGLTWAMPTVRGQSASTDAPSFSGVWTLNRDQSTNPEHAGFSQGPGARGGRAPLGGGVFGAGQGGLDAASGNDASTDPKDVQRKIEELTNEVRNPSPMLTITQVATDLTFIDSQGRIRTLHATGKKETQQLSSGTVDSTTRWDGTRLVSEYDVASGRKLTYTYTLVPGEKPQLLVLIKFEGRGTSPLITQVYNGSPRP